MAAIPYSTNQPAHPQLWNSCFCPISIFRINKYLEEDTKNIACFLYRITFFIRQRSLDDKNANNILQIAEFRYISWNFISFIYELEYDKLTVHKNNKSFR